MTTTSHSSAVRPTQRQLLTIAFPNMLAALAVPLAELVDLAFLGHLQDVNQLSGVVLAVIIFDYIFWSFGFLRMGTTGLVAQAIGAKDRGEQAALFWRAFLMAIFFGSILTLAQTGIGQLGFLMLSGDAAVEKAGLDYFSMHIWGAIPTLVNYACIGWLLGQHRARDIIIISLFWQGGNITLDYYYIVELGMGAAGAGLALAIASWISAVVALILVVRAWKGIPDFNYPQIVDWQKAKTLIVLNSSILVRTFLLITVLATFTNISATFGAVALAANAILMRLWVSFAYIVDGFAIALETLGGTYWGAKDHTALRRAFNLTIRWNIFITIGFIAAYSLFDTAIFNLLNEHEEITKQAEEYLPWLLLTLAVGGFAFVYDGFFLGIANASMLMKSMVVSCLIYLPFPFIAIHYNSLNWLWAGMFIFIGARALSLWWPSRKVLKVSSVAG